ncbi:hypothetical protein FHW17_000583 [Phyllobacterium sp. P30BS-XVII]|nr:hypothetical protein [Phyllobacterium sp. P30BS-XVII]SDO57923.1 hypothetical protein SAMN05443582_102543 [Phyllobacterium sp. OV277]
MISRGILPFIAVDSFVTQEMERWNDSTEPGRKEFGRGDTG